MLIISRLTANLLAVACSTALSCYRSLHVRKLISSMSILLVLVANRMHILRLSGVSCLPRPFAACSTDTPLCRLKDSDVTWLYGPLHTSNVDPVPKPKEASAIDKLNVDSQTKPILKHRSISDILALGAVPPRPLPLIGSPLYEDSAIEEHEEESLVPPSPTEEHLENASVPPNEAILHAPSRPPLWHTKSDSIVLRNRFSTSPQPPNPNTLPISRSPPHRKTPSPSPPGRFASRKSARSDSSSSVQHSDAGSYASSTTHGGGRMRQNGRPRRHISFNSFVEQRIVIDPPAKLPTVHSRSLSDSGSDDEQLEMRKMSSSGNLTSRRLSSGSRSSSNTTAHPADEPPKLTRITAPFPPALLKEALDLPAPSPAVVFVPPSGADRQGLEYQLIRAASASSNGVRSPYGFQGGRIASPNSLNRSPELVGASQGDWGYQEKMLDYFSGVPVQASGRRHSRRLEPTELNGSILLDDDGLVREPVYTDEDADAITVRRRRSGGSLRSGKSGRSGSGSSINGSSGSIATPSTFIAAVAPSGPMQWPLIGAGQTPSSTNLAADGPSLRAGTQAQHPSSIPSATLGGVSAPATRGRGGPLPRSTGFDLDDTGETTSALGGRSQSYSGGGGGRIGFGGLVRNASAVGVSGANLSSGGSGSGSGSGSSGGSGGSGGAPPFESRGRSMNGPGGGVGGGAAEEPPRRGRSLLRTASSSSISERERSSTGGSSASPIGSLSPRPGAGIIGSSSVGIIGGRDSSMLGIVARGRAGSSLRYESGSWSRSRDASEEDGNEDDEDDDEEEEETRREFVGRPGTASPIRRHDGGPSLVRTSSSSQIVPRSGAGLVRSHSSVGEQDGLFSSTRGGAALPPPPLPAPSKTSVKFNCPPPSSSVRPPPRPPTPGGKRGRAMHLDLNETDEKESGDSTTNSPSPWSTSEFAVPWRERTSLELDSSVSPPSPNGWAQTASDSGSATSSGPTADPVYTLKLPIALPVRPKASGASLTSAVSTESNASAGSAVTVVPIPSRINELRSPHHATHPHAPQQTDNMRPVISAPTPVLSNSSTVLSSALEQTLKKDISVPSKAGTKPSPPKAIVSPTTKSPAPTVFTAAAVAVEPSSPSPFAMAVTRNAAKRHSESLSRSSRKKGVSSSSISSNDESRSPQRIQPSPPPLSPNSAGVLAGVVGHAKIFFGAIWGGTPE